MPALELKFPEMMAVASMVNALPASNEKLAAYPRVTLSIGAALETDFTPITSAKTIAKTRINLKGKFRRFA